MKTINKFSLSALILAVSAGSGFAQARSISGNGFDSGGINIIPKNDPKKSTKTVKTIQLVAVSKERVWKSSDKKQKPIIGSLLAFEHEEKSGKVRIVRDENVRMRVGKKNFAFPLAKLSLDDQAFVQKLVDSARIAGKLIEPKAEKTAISKSNVGSESPFSGTWQCSQQGTVMTIVFGKRSGKLSGKMDMTAGGAPLKTSISQLKEKSASELTFHVNLEGGVLQARAVLSEDEKSFALHTTDSVGDTAKYNFMRK